MEENEKKEADLKENSERGSFVIPPLNDKHINETFYKKTPREVRDYGLWSISILSMLLTPSTMLFLGVFGSMTRRKLVSPVEFAFSLLPYGESLGFTESNLWKSLDGQQKIVLISGTTAFTLLDLILTSVTIPLITSLLHFTNYGIIALGLALMGVAAFKAVELIGKSLYEYYSRSERDDFMVYVSLVAAYVKSPNSVHLEKIVSSVPVRELGQVFRSLRASEKFDDQQLRECAENIYRSYDIKNNVIGGVTEFIKTVVEFVKYLPKSETYSKDPEKVWKEAREKVTMNRGIHRVSKDEYDQVKQDFNTYKLKLIAKGQSFKEPVKEKTKSDVLFSSKQAFNVRKVGDGNDWLITTDQYKKFVVCGKKVKEEHSAIERFKSIQKQIHPEPSAPPLENDGKMNDGSAQAKQAEYINLSVVPSEGESGVKGEKLTPLNLRASSFSNQDNTVNINYYQLNVQNPSDASSANVSNYLSLDSQGADVSSSSNQSSNDEIKYYPLNSSTHWG